MISIENLTTELDSDSGLVRAVDALTLTIAEPCAAAAAEVADCPPSN